MASDELEELRRRLEAFELADDAQHRVVDLERYKLATALAEKLDRSLRWFDEVGVGQPSEASILLQGAAWAIRDLLALLPLGHWPASVEHQVKQLALRSDRVFARLERVPGDDTE